MSTLQYTQENRPIRLSTPLGEDVLLLQNLIYKEELGRPFELTLEMQSTDGNIDYQEILGQSVTVTIVMEESRIRHLNGIVRKFSQTDFDQHTGLYAYRAEVVPWISMLKLTKDCRAYQHQTIPEIITAVFKDFHFSDFTLRLTKPYVAREFCVQYRESAFDFVHRLMEIAGITYFFEHAIGKHTIVFADSRAAYDQFQDIESIPYHSQTIPDGGAILSWRRDVELGTGSVQLDDYDYAKPKSGLLGKAEHPQNHPQGNYEYYDFPAGYHSRDSPDAWALVKITQLNARTDVAKGTTNFAGISTGYKFNLTGFPREDQNSSYLTISSRLTIDTAPYNSEFSGNATETTIRNEFEVIHSNVRYYNPPITPKPMIRGVQTAVVAGPEGQVTPPYVSPYGSVVLQFHWDRYGQSNEKSSIWIRCSQLSAGAGWGSMFIPAIGNEVVVAFEEGDPDRPVIVGRVYNALQMPKLPLPANSLKSYICDQGGDIICFHPQGGNESIHLYSPHNNSSKSVGASPGMISF